MILATTKEWTFNTAQTDFLLQAGGALEQLIVGYAQVTCAHSNTVDVDVRIGFGASTLPTKPVNSSTGVTGVILSHGGIAPGGGAVAANGEAPLAYGAAGDDIRVTLTTPTGGDVRVVLSYRINDLTPPA